MVKASFLGLGTPVVDYFYRIEEESLAGFGLIKGSSNFVDNARFEQIKKDIGEGLIEARAGDNARNMCESFSRLSRDDKTRVVFCGTIAEDEVGKKISEAADKNGYENIFQKNDGHSGKIMCLITPDKQRTFVVFLGVSEDCFDISTLPEAEYIYFSSISALTKKDISKSCEEMIKRYEGRAKIVFSFESPAMIEANRKKAVEIAKKADILFLNEEEQHAAGLSEDDLKNICPLVYLKLGGRGAKVIQEKRISHVPAPIVEKIVDTTGAGDTFAATVVWALFNGKSVIDAAKIGHMAAGATICRVGNSIPEEFTLATNDL